ncbi:hypothetical protein RWH43_02150 [Microbacterium sp. KSW2-21]|uniref:MFS transporter n=1 Tax=Microbacterium algihabitans TaxID=3075992 RepID=A0ABU3RRV2_9MICO|nr:hypothetical protein [Microbacterium sp. KSW2-21]MDU0325549.1 hypothetical protein [Microbacterium sp. KSW2-21]
MAGRMSRASRVAVLVVVIVVLLAYALGAGVLLGLTSPRRAGGEVFLATAAIGGFAVGPMLMGSWLTFWDPRRSRGSRQMFRRMWIVMGVVEIASVALIIAYAVLVGAPTWLPVVFIAGGAVLMAAAYAIGPALRNADRHQVAGEVASIYPPEERRRDIRRIALTAVITFVIMGILSLSLGLIFGAEENWFPLVGLPIAMTLFIGGGVGAMFPSYRLGRRARALVDGDLGRLRAIGKVVLGNKKVELTPEDEEAAARYAPVAPALLTYQLISLGALIAGQGILQINTLLSETSDPAFRVFSAIFLGLVIVGLAVVIPLQLRQIRRAQAYASAHPVPRSGATATSTVEV